MTRVEQMREHCVVFPTPSGGCHTLWVLGHLAYIEALVIRTFMLGEANPLAECEGVFDGADVNGEISQYPLFDDVLAKCREVRASTVALLDSLSERDLDRVSAKAPEGFEDTFGTYRVCPGCWTGTNMVVGTWNRRYEPCGYGVRARRLQFVGGVLTRRWSRQTARWIVLRKLGVCAACCSSPTR